MHRVPIGTIFLLAAAMLIALAVPALAQERTFTSPMSGDEEVPPVETDATGDAEYVLNADGSEISFTVDVAGLVDTTMAHIHLAPAGENGPPVVWLHTQAQEPQLVEGETTGTLVSGTFTADDLVGPLEGGTLDELVDEMAAGNTYTNVHTEEFPDGEIRGQIAEVESEMERPDRVDTGAGGAAGSTGVAPLALAAGLALIVIGVVTSLIVRRRVSA